MKTTARIIAACASLCLGACATVESGMSKAVSFIDSPATQQAVGTLNGVAVALVCAIANVSGVAGVIENGVGAGKSMIGTDGKVYVASATTCAALGGVVGDSVPIAQVPK